MHFPFRISRHGTVHTPCLSYFLLWDEYPTPKMKEGKVYLAHSYWRFQSILGWIQGREAHGRKQQFIAAEQQWWRQRQPTKGAESNSASLSLCLSLYYIRLSVLAYLPQATPIIFSSIKIHNLIGTKTHNPSETLVKSQSIEVPAPWLHEALGGTTRHKP